MRVSVCEAFHNDGGALQQCRAKGDLWNKGGPLPGPLRTCLSADRGEGGELWWVEVTVLCKVGMGFGTGQNEKKSFAVSANGL